MPSKNPHTFHSRKCKKTINDNIELNNLVKNENDSQYDYYHGSPKDDVVVINSIRGLNAKCPYCESDNVINWGKNRRRCNKCKRTFSPSSATLLDQHKVPIKTMLRFYINIISGSSVNEASKVAKISLNTSIYWMDKAFIALKDFQNQIVLSGNVYIDEKYISVDKSKIIFDDKGKKLRGLSRNKFCIAIGTDRINTIARLEGKGKVSSEKVMDAFAKNIKLGSTLIHDMDHSHDKLINSLLLKDEGHKAIYKYKQVEELEPINKYCSSFADFFRLHRGLNKDKLQDWLNLFSFIHSDIGDTNQKAAKVIELIIKSDKILRYRR